MEYREKYDPLQKVDFMKISFENKSFAFIAGTLTHLVSHCQAENPGQA